MDSRKLRRVSGLPVGVERVLYAAARDRRFCEALLRRRDAAAQGFGLRPSEMAMLRAIPEQQLRATIDGVDASPGNVERRTFLRAVAATSVGIATAASLQGCGDDDDNPSPDSGPSTDGGGGGDVTVEAAIWCDPAADGCRP